MRYNKLVRDRIPEIITKKGSRATIHTATDEEYLQKLREKLQEEVDEFMRDNTGEELADILEVVYALAVTVGVPVADLETKRKQKKEERGGFEKKIILDETD